MNLHECYQLLIEKKPKHPRHILRYIKLISSYKNNPKVKFNTERHHILPTHMFPQFSTLKENEWNGVNLPIRAHYIAHMLLFLAFRDVSTSASVQRMKNGSAKHYISKIYELSRVNCSVANYKWVHDDQNEFYIHKDELDSYLASNPNSSVGRISTSSKHMSENSKKIKLQEYFKEVEYQTDRSKVLVMFYEIKKLMEVGHTINEIINLFDFEQSNKNKCSIQNFLRNVIPPEELIKTARDKYIQLYKSLPQITKTYVTNTILKECRIVPFSDLPKYIELGWVEKRTKFKNISSFIPFWSGQKTYYKQNNIPQKVYVIFDEYNKGTVKNHLITEFGFSERIIRTYYKKFELGWNPHTDPQWKADFPE